MAKIYNTVTTIPVEEIQRVLDKGQKMMGDMAIEAGLKKIYGMGEKDGCQRRLLYMYCYAIESWLVCTDGVNYMCEKDLINLLSAVEQMFYTCGAK